MSSELREREREKSMSVGKKKSSGPSVVGRGNVRSPREHVGRAG